MYGLAPESIISQGGVTDKYFERTEDALEHAGKNPQVVAEITADQFSTERQIFEGDEYEVLAGVEYVADLLEGLDVTVESLPEGALFNGGPVMNISGNYLDFARFETAILGFLSHASGVATRAYEVYQSRERSEGFPTVLSFGTRHVHPGIAPMIERSALVGGMDGFSNTGAEEELKRSAKGTMPHALMLTFGKGNQEDAWRAFNESAPENVPRILLCDTFTDEVDEVLRAVRELGDDIDGVRIDTTGSRRGDFEHIIKEVQWELESEGYEDVGIYVSGGLGPEDVKEIGHLVEGFGIGSYISNGEPVDFSLDIVEVDGEPISKRGKKSCVKEIVCENMNPQIKRKNEIEPDNSLFETIVDSGEIQTEFNVETAQANRNKFEKMYL